MRSSLADPDREQGAAVFDPDVTSVMDESRPADGKTQRVQLPIIWLWLSAVLYVGETGSLCTQKRGDTGEKWDMCFLALCTCPSTGSTSLFHFPFSNEVLHVVGAEWEMFGCRGNTFPKWNNSRWLDDTPFFLVIATLDLNELLRNKSCTKHCCHLLPISCNL